MRSPQSENHPGPGSQPNKQYAVVGNEIHILQDGAEIDLSDVDIKKLTQAHIINKFGGPCVSTFKNGRVYFETIGSQCIKITFNNIYKMHTIYQVDTDLWAII